MIYETIKKALLEYADSEPVLLPPLPDHEPDTLKYVWASSLGYCPLATALKRQGVEPKFPLTDNERISDIIRFAQGNRTASLYQEAMLNKFGYLQNFALESFFRGQEERGSAIAEKSIYSDTLKLKGRADLLYRTGSEIHIIEIKRPHDGAGLEPKHQYLLQTLAYKMILEELYPQFTIYAHVLISNFDIFKIWSLRHDGENVYLAFDEMGEIAKDFSGNLLIVSYGDVLVEVQRQLAYLQGKTDIPFPDFLHQKNEGSWQCCRWSKPKKYKGIYKGETERLETAKRACPYFCFADELEGGMYFTVRETEYESGKYVPVFGEPY